MDVTVHGVTLMGAKEKGKTVIEVVWEERNTRTVLLQKANTAVEHSVSQKALSSLGSLMNCAGHFVTSWVFALFKCQKMIFQKRTQNNRVFMAPALSLDTSSLYARLFCLVYIPLFLRLCGKTCSMLFRESVVFLHPFLENVEVFWN